MTVSIPDEVDLKTVYRPRGASRKMFSCHDREILLEGPAGTGKTRSILEKVYLCAMKYEGMRALLVRKTRASCTTSILVTFEEKVVPSGSPILLGPDRKNRQSYRLGNGSEIVIGGMDRADKTLSTEYDMIIAFEATELTINDWEMLQRAKRNNVMPYQQSIADCNPAGSRHWLNQRAKTDQMKRLLSRHEDNPMLYNEDGTLTPAGDEYINGVLSRFSGARLQRLRYGKWAEAQGVVYPDYDPAIHWIQPFPIPSSWRRIRSIDFGFKNPFICQWWAMDNDDRMYLYREIYMSARIVEDHAKQINALTDAMANPDVANVASPDALIEFVEATVADHDAEDRATLDRYSVSTDPATKTIRGGIDAVTSRLKKQRDGRPALFIFQDALVELDDELAQRKLPTCTAHEFEAYIWPTLKESPNVRNPREVPLDRDNHGMDALRYAVAYIDGVGTDVLPIGIPSVSGGTGGNDIDITDPNTGPIDGPDLNDDDLWQDA